MKKEFKVGQRYRVEYDGTGESGNIIEITKVERDFIHYKTIKGVNAIRDTFGIKSAFARSLKLIDENMSIHIYADGKTTTAVLKKGKVLIKKAKAKCSPEDEFDYETGARLAFKRLFTDDATGLVHVGINDDLSNMRMLGININNNQLTEIADRLIEVVEAHKEKYTLDDFIKGGIAVKFETKKERRQFLRACQNRGLKWMSGSDPLDWAPLEIEYFIECEDEQYLVFDKNYYDELKYIDFKDFDQSESDQSEPEKIELAERKPYNAKLVCVDDNHAPDFTKGKIYEVKDGMLHGNCHTFSTDAFDKKPFESLDQINDMMRPDFIELKDE